ncbi:MAG: FAD-dependent oxidoreductase [Paracoccaceae bacterium]|nr:FAD-dependent oxidoreductase [Paracoccaceae bacterium]
MTRTADAVIIGAGVIGTAIALELNRKGYRTISIDRNPAAGYGPTSGSCAIVRVHYSTRDGTAFAYEGYHDWRDWEDYLGVRDPRGTAEFRETGCLVMQTESNGHLEKHMSICEDLGVPYEVWNGEDILRRLPFYDLQSFAPARRLDDPDFGKPNGGRIRGGVFWQTAGYVTDPALSAQNLQCAAEVCGGRFIFGRTVTGISTASGRVTGVSLDDGSTIQAPVVVNVAGPFSASVNSMAGVDGDMTISTRALKQEVVHVPAPEGCDFYGDGFVISDSDIGCYVRPEKGNFILVGSEDPECDPREWVDPETYDRNFTDQWTHQALRYAQRVPTLGIPSRMRGIVDLYDVTDDWIPIYDRSALPGFYMAVGTSGNQYKNAPIAGKMMAALIDHCEAGHDHDREPLQFRLPYTGLDIDVGFYSRNREINMESSFSVLG